MATADGDNANSHPNIRESIAQVGTPGSVPATNHATTWQCPASQHIRDPAELKLLSHVNCSYLSGDQAPTLLELKKHAQSLSILIRKLTLQTTFGVPDAEANDMMGKSHWMNYRFKQNEAFDWLNDLSVPYENHDAFHHFPLHSLHNEVQSEDDIQGVKYHCPLHHATRDHSSHMALLHHANECLEILDHDHSAVGGLLALLPSHEGDSEEMRWARNTLVGQWLLFQHYLIGRMHELEIEYANACSSLSWESEIPKQIVSKQTFEQRLEGHNVAHLQDKFILVNAGTPAHEEIHRLLDEEEKKMEERARQWADANVLGDRMSQEISNNDQELLSKGLVRVDLTSRFYRVKGNGPQAAVFVLPAIEHQGTLKRTMEMEKNPGVVTVPMSNWPVRVSEWERKYKEKIHKADVATEWEPAVQKLREENAQLQEEIRLLKIKEAGNYPRWGGTAGV